VEILINKIIGILLIGLSLLTSAIVISLGQVSRAIKQAATKNFGISDAFGEIPGIVYIIIIIAVCFGFYLLNNNRDFGYFIIKYIVIKMKDT
jgi:hypothetical protein